MNSPEDMLHEALETKNDEAIIQIIMSYSRKERLSIKENYNLKFEKSLEDEISDKLGGEFKKTVIKLFLSRAEFDARELYRALKAFNIDDDAIYEIIMGRPEKILKEIETIYSTLDKNSLENTLYKKLDKKIRQALITFLKTPRSINTQPNDRDCSRKADLLVSVLPEKWLSDEEIIRIFAISSPQELVLIARFYLEKTGTHIQKAIAKISKIQRNFITALYYNVAAPAEYTAYKLYESLKGIGTDDNLLQREIITRYDADMPLTKKFYTTLYKNTLEDDVEDDTSGAYRHLLISLVKYLD